MRKLTVGQLREALAACRRVLRDDPDNKQLRGAVQKFEEARPNALLHQESKQRRRKEEDNA